MGHLDDDNDDDDDDDGGRDADANDYDDCCPVDFCRMHCRHSHCPHAPAGSPGRARRNFQQPGCQSGLRRRILGLTEDCKKRGNLLIARRPNSLKSDLEIPYLQLGSDVAHNCRQPYFAGRAWG